MINTYKFIERSIYENQGCFVGFNGFISFDTISARANNLIEIFANFFRSHVIALIQDLNCAVVYTNAKMLMYFTIIF